MCGGSPLQPSPARMVAQNNLLKYGLTELNMRFRKRLTKHLMKEYLTGYTYYQVANMDNRIANADQLLTQVRCPYIRVGGDEHPWLMPLCQYVALSMEQDVQHFCKSCTDLYSNLSKPLLDIGLYTYKLATTIGMQGPSNMLGWVACCVSGGRGCYALAYVCCATVRVGTS